MLKKRIALYALLFAALTINHSNLMGKNDYNSIHSDASQNLDRYFSRFYNELELSAPKPDYEVFIKALTGFFSLKAEERIKNNLLTIIDFTLSSNVERLWVVDMMTMKVVHFSLVAHGRNSGDEFAKDFSNRISSNQSSLGFFLTDGIYIGKHGKSLYLDGVEPNVNDKARVRTVVMHGADYVSKDYIQNNGRLGRSFGCPSIPMEGHEKIITLLSGRSCIYIHYPDEQYLSNSKLLNQEKAVAGLYAFLSETQVAYDFYPELSSIKRISNTSPDVFVLALPVTSHRDCIHPF
jgi:hypothetical protein